MSTIACKYLGDNPTNNYGAGYVAIGTKIYHLGGTGDAKTICAAHVYDIETDVWSILPSMPTHRHSFGCVAIDKKIYCIGGNDGNTGFPTDVVEIYDTATSTWTTGTPMPTGRSRMGCIAVGNLISCIAGREYNVDRNYMEIYNATTDSWSTGIPMPVGGECYCVFYYQNKIRCSLYNLIYDFDPGTNEWAFVSNKSLSTGALVGNKVYSPFAWNMQIYDMDSHTVSSVPISVGVSDRSPILAIGNMIYYALYAGQHWAFMVDGAQIIREFKTKQNVEIKPKTYDAAAIGEDYSIQGPDLPGYICIDHRIDDGPVILDPAVLIENVQGAHTVIHVYESAEGKLSVTEKYQDEDGNTLLPDFLKWHNAGSGYSRSAPAIQRYACFGYIIDDGEVQPGATATILDIQANHTVTFLYKDVGGTGEGEGDTFTITEQYQIQNSTQLRQDTSTPVAQGNTYTKTAPGISGYTCVGHKLDGGELQSGDTVSIADVQANHTITFVYKKN